MSYSSTAHLRSSCAVLLYDMLSNGCRGSTAEVLSSIALSSTVTATIACMSLLSTGSVAAAMLAAATMPVLQCSSSSS